MRFVSRKSNSLVLLFAALAVFSASAAATARAVPKRMGNMTARQGSMQTSPAPPADAAAALHKLFDLEWDYQMEHNPVTASFYGDRRWNDRWEDLSIHAIQRQHEHELEVLGDLHRIPRASLSPEDQLNYDLFEKNYKLSIEGYPFHLWLMPVNQMGGIQSANEIADALRFETVKDYEDWLARLRAFPAYMDQTIALMKQGESEKLLPPRVIMERVLPEIDGQLVADPAKSPFYAPFLHFPAAIPVPEQQRIAAAAQSAIHDAIIPSFRKFRDFYTTEYLPACYTQVGAWQLPHGGEIYSYLVRRETTTNLTPPQIHEIGLREVARIRAEMQQVMNQVGFQGSLLEFFRYLRTDPKFFYSNPADLFEAYQATAKTIDPNLVKVFRILPRMPYGVEAIPAESAPNQTTAYYRQGSADGSRAGTYFVNLYKPETRPKWEMMALTLHESVPGHHLQIALAIEQPGIPKFRRLGGYTAFVEGWALYSESLGEEMGLYSDPYSKFGELTYDMWRAVRLVVDTGIHSMHWDRQRAINFFLDNAPKTELDVTNEIDRYIAWPGQALAYKVGQLKIRELRARAAERLGPRFDLRDFHEAVLREGALPLDVLEQRLDVWIASQQSEKPASR